MRSSPQACNSTRTGYLKRGRQAGSEARLQRQIPAALVVLIGDVAEIHVRTGGGTSKRQTGAADLENPVQPFQVVDHAPAAAARLDPRAPGRNAPHVLLRILV